MKNKIEELVTIVYNMNITSFASNVGLDPTTFRLKTIMAIDDIQSSLFERVYEMNLVLIKEMFKDDSEMSSLLRTMIMDGLPTPLFEQIYQKLEE